MRWDKPARLVQNVVCGCGVAGFDHLIVPLILYDSLPSRGFWPKTVWSEDTSLRVSEAVETEPVASFPPEQCGISER